MIGMVLHGVYAITPAYDDTLALCRLIEQALEGGICCVQYRHKTAGPQQRQAQASALLALCRAYHVPLIINDDVDLAYRLQADGVHLGKDDIDPVAARCTLGEHAIIGVSCYADMNRAHHVQAQGADYVAFGACFASRTKPHAPTIDLTLISQARASLSIPCVAIGGITLENSSAVIMAGAHAIALVDGLFSTADIATTVRSLVNEFRVSR